MNPLLQISKSGILERQFNSTEAISDKYVLAAIEAYDKSGSTTSKAINFIEALLPLWKKYKKEAFVPLFRAFIELENSLEMASHDHISHVNHVIQEFLLGYNILMNCGKIKRNYGYGLGRKQYESKFGELLFSWMAASLLHDIGYDIEKAPEEEIFRRKKNEFWSFMTSRSITTGPLEIKVSDEAMSLFEEILYKEAKELMIDEKTFTQFQQLFCRQVNDPPGWVKYDHGFASSIKYLSELRKLENYYGGTYLKWDPNINAVLAMALHNFRYKDCNISLNCSNPRALIAYLLIVCDEVQEWERERIDYDVAVTNEEMAKGKNSKESTKLTGITFRTKYCYLILNHKLKDKAYKNNFVSYMDDKIVNQKKDYPIEVYYPYIEHKAMAYARNKIDREEYDFGSTVSNGYIKIDTESMRFADIPEERMEMFRAIAQTETKKELLTPTPKTPMYKVILGHRIDDEPYLTIAFLM